jgi:hypothetical protein
MARKISGFDDKARGRLKMVTHSLSEKAGSSVNLSVRYSVYRCGQFVDTSFVTD